MHEYNIATDAYLYFPQATYGNFTGKISICLFFKLALIFNFLYIYTFYLLYIPMQ